jgi:hypothetical protein
MVMGLPSGEWDNSSHVHRKATRPNRQDYLFSHKPEGTSWNTVAQVRERTTRGRVTGPPDDDPVRGKALTENDHNL